MAPSYASSTTRENLSFGDKANAMQAAVVEGFSDKDDRHNASASEACRPVGGLGRDPSVDVPSEAQTAHQAMLAPVATGGRVTRHSTTREHAARITSGSVC